MPFDNTNVLRESAVRDPPVPTDPLERLGITPVPAEFVAKYKRRYRGIFVSKALRGLGPYEWRNFALPCAPTNRNLDWFLSGEISRALIGSDLSDAPKPLFDVAERVRDTIPEATFSLDYFYRDPLLYAHYWVGQEPRAACLGIWDKGVIKAIAGVPVPQRRGFFATLFGGRSFAE